MFYIRPRYNIKKVAMQFLKKKEIKYINIIIYYYINIYFS